MRVSGEPRFKRRANRRGRSLVCDLIAGLEEPLDRWDTAAIASEMGADPQVAFVGARYAGRRPAKLQAAVLRDRIRRVFWQAEPVPEAPRQYVDVDAISVGETIVSLPRLLAGRSASALSRQSGVPRTTVQRIQAGQTRTSIATALAVLQVVDEATAMALEGERVDADVRYRQYLAPVVEQIARGGRVGAWRADRQLLPKLRRRLARLEAEQKLRPRRDTDAQLELVRSRIADLEDRDDLPPFDVDLEREALEILNSRQKGVPQLRRAGLHPGGAQRRKDELAAALGLRDEADVQSIDTGRLYKLRGLARQPSAQGDPLDE
jgi:hypothetical protein